MKIFILWRAWVVAVLLVFFWPAGPLAADEPKGAVVKTVLKLEPEIDCPSCEDGIKHTLVTAHGVQSAEVDVLTNKVTVRYDPARIKLQALIGRISVIGYKATEVK